MPVVDAYAAAEVRLGRPLHLAERAVDIVQLDRDLAAGKQRLHAAVKAEQARAVKAHFRRGATVRLRVTPQMQAALAWLYEKGRQHAQAELLALTGLHVAAADTKLETMRRITGKLQLLLHDLERKLNARIGQSTGDRLALAAAGVREFAAQLTVGDIAHTAAMNQALKIPGALNVASQLVTDSAYSGVGSVFDTAAGLFTSWVYSAVMDNATCDVCAELDGEEFASWDDIQTVLPDGGPNPECDGGDRCRCRAVPGEMAEVAAPEGLTPTEPSIAEQLGALGAPPPEIGEKVAQLIESGVGTQDAAIQLDLEGVVNPLKGKYGGPWSPKSIRTVYKRHRGVKNMPDTKQLRTPPPVGVDAPPRVGLRSFTAAIKTGLPNDVERARAEADRLRTAFVRKGASSTSEAKEKKKIAEALSNGLRNNADWRRSVGARRSAATARERLSEYVPGEQVELPAYPGFRYRVTSLPDAEGRMELEIVAAPPGEEATVGNAFRIDKGRRAIAVGVKEPVVQRFKYELPRTGHAADSDDEKVVAGLIDRWAITSADNDVWALAIQRAVKDEFDLADDTLRHFELEGRYGAANWVESREIYDEHGPALRAFVRQMWQNTQDELRKAGFDDEVVLYRGQGFSADEFVSGAHRELRIRLQPASSASSTYDEAVKFARSPGGVVSMRVPVERVMGSCRTGYGCFHEHELILLGNPIGADADIATAYLQDAVSYGSEATWWGRFATGEARPALKATGKATPPGWNDLPFGAYADEHYTEEWQQMLQGKLHVEYSAKMEGPDALTEDMLDEMGQIPTKIMQQAMTQLDGGIWVGLKGVSEADDLGQLAGSNIGDGAGVFSSAKHAIAVDVGGSSSSASVLIHEIGHAFDKATGFSGQQAFREWHMDLYPKLSPYLQGSSAGSIAGSQELFAESFAVWSTGGTNALTAEFGHDYALWFSDQMLVYSGYA